MIDLPPGTSTDEPVHQNIREALQASLPVAPEQLMTVQVPGVVIDCGKTGPYWWNDSEYSETPHRVKVNEARLVDGMIPLSKIMVCSLPYFHLPTLLSW